MVFDRLTLADIHQDVARNIVSLRQSQDLFDDLTDDPVAWLLAQKVEDEVKPPPYRSGTPVIDRPFEDAEWFNAIIWPFKHWQSSRFSDGSHGVWYGSESVETTVHESSYHWYRGLLGDAGFERMTVIAERKVYRRHAAQPCWISARQPTNTRISCIRRIMGSASRWEPGFTGRDTPAFSPNRFAGLPERTWPSSIHACFPIPGTTAC